MAKRCPYGVSKVDKVTCLMYPRKRGKKGRKKGRRKSRSRGPAGSPLYADIMTFARGGRRFSCASNERAERATKAARYLGQLYEIESRHGVNDSVQRRRLSALERTSKAVRAILVESCFKGRNRITHGPVQRP